MFAILKEHLQKDDFVAFSNLLKEKGKIDEINKYDEDTGLTILHEAVQMTGPKTSEYVKLLLENNADPNALSKENETALHQLIRTVNVNNIKSETICKLLLTHGANPNLMGKYHKNLLEYCFKYNGRYYLPILLQFQADVNFLNQNGLRLLNLNKHISQYGVQDLELLVSQLYIDPELTNRCEHTTLQCAMLQLNLQLVEVLLRFDVHLDYKDEKILNLLHYLISIDERKHPLISIIFYHIFKRHPNCEEYLLNSNGYKHFHAYIEEMVALRSNKINGSEWTFLEFLSLDITSEELVRFQDDKVMAKLEESEKEIKLKYNIFKKIIKEKKLWIGRRIFQMNRLNSQFTNAKSKNYCPLYDSNDFSNIKYKLYRIIYRYEHKLFD